MKKLDALAQKTKNVLIILSKLEELKQFTFEKKFRADLIIENKILVENKAIKRITNQDEAQLINYLKTTHLRVGLLFNFGAEKFKMLRRVF